MIVATSGTSVAGTEVINGQLGALVLSVPALTGTGTITIVGKDDLGGSIYALTSAVESTAPVIAPIGTPTFFDGTLTLTINETSGTQDANASIKYNIYYQTKQG